MNLAGVRAAYDTVAVSYAQLLEGQLAESPWDRAVLGAFASLVPGGRLVADLGCGPGRITGHLCSLGLPVIGVDLSPGMLREGRRRHPGLPFAAGDLAALPFPDAALGGALAWYSIIHTPSALLPLVVTELERVLAPGAPLGLAFQVGSDVRHHERPYGHDVELVIYRNLPEDVEALLSDAGLQVTARLVRSPEGREQTDQCYLMATKTG